MIATRRPSTGHSLAGMRVLVVEDEYYLANDLQTMLEGAGAIVVGPFATETAAQRALDGIAADGAPRCALVDINLGHGVSFAPPRVLRQRGIPFAFVTGYDAGAIPPDFAAVERCEKPVAVRLVAALAARLVANATAST